jgi:hypothetical protein
MKKESFYALQWEGSLLSHPSPVGRPEPTSEQPPTYHVLQLVFLKHTYQKKIKLQVSADQYERKRGGIYFKYKIQQFFSTCKVSYLQETSMKQERSGKRVLRAASAELAKWHNFVDKGFCQAFAIVNERTRQI